MRYVHSTWVWIKNTPGGGVENINSLWTPFLCYEGDNWEGIQIIMYVDSNVIDNNVIDNIYLHGEAGIQTMRISHQLFHLFEVLQPWT